jgi:hypothetical protein
MSEHRELIRKHVLKRQEVTEWLRNLCNSELHNLCSSSDTSNMVNSNDIGRACSKFVSARLAKLDE